MDHETIIRLARESGLWEILTRYTSVFAGKNAKPEELIWGSLERFAALVTAHERERCAKMCDFYADKIGTGNITGKALIATAFEIRNRK